MVRECSCCKRVALPSTSDWLELEVAIARYHLLDGDRFIRITHGICDACLSMLDVDLGHV